MTAFDYPFNSFTGLELADGYAEARERPGLTRVRLPFGEPAWLVTRYEEAKQVLADRRFSRAEAHRRDAPRALSRIPGGIVTMDPPELTRIRGLAVKTFTPQRVERLRPHVRRLANELIDLMEDVGAPADLVKDFSLPIPISVICELLGVPARDHERFRLWNDALLATDLPPEEVQRKLGELAGYFTQLIVKRREEPAEDLISALVEACDADDELSEKDLMLLCIALLVAGYEATASQIPNFLHVLLRNPDQLARLRAEPELVPDAVEELLRFVPLASSAMFAHYPSEDVQVGETLVRQGEPVLVSIGSANRDAARFEQGEVLDLSRNAQGHLAFGYGIHHCVGAPLGRVELQEAVRALVTRLPGLRQAGEIEWKTATFFRGPLSMPVTW
ncbi:cytochrome [Amycolatopsis orientalis]|uniref:Cytochrome n=1 Tax=Amycolatopsis orientalis TaxID=31958 RepID=A0A193BTF4_AMYOR|nr:cytochrome P450 [Amycolatopsis orientalis]ANN15491.1 cytochrome [Amycolatopsis orientalis]